MIVVADASPFIGLIKIGHIDVLPRLFGNIYIPLEVAAELRAPARPPAVLSFGQTNFRVPSAALDALLARFESEHGPTA